MRMLLALALIVLGPAAEAKWLRAESAHFVGYLDGSEDVLRAHMVRLERFDHLLRTRTQIADDAVQIKPIVFFANGLDAVQSLYGAKNNDVAGFYVATLSGGLAVVPKAGDEGMTAGVILFHEYVHHYMAQYFRGATPAWYAEGFAEVLSTTRFDKGGVPEVGLPAQHRLSGLYYGRDLPIRRLLTSSTSELKGTEIDAYYGRSWLLTHYLMFNSGRAGQLTAYLALIAQGTPALQSAESAFGDLDVLDKELDHYLNNNKFTYFKIVGQSEPRGNLAIAPVSEGEGAAMMLKFAMTRGTRPDEAAEQAAKMRKIAAKFPSDAKVLTLLAEAESDAHSWDAAIAAADQALKLNEKIVYAHMWKGASMTAKLADAKDSDSEKWEQARSNIISANRLNTEDPAPLYYYYVSFLRQKIEPTQNAIDALGKAQSLVPQDPSLTFQYAVALEKSKNYAGALKLLQPLANSPHDSGYKKSAAKLIETIRATESERAQSGSTARP